jgi:hypothetical protein
MSSVTGTSGIVSFVFWAKKAPTLTIHQFPVKAC